VACYDRALELTPDDILPDYEKWRIIAILGNQPFPWNLHYHKADILAELGRLEEAIESCDQALKFLGDENIEKKHYVYKRKIKVLKELGTLQEALEGCDEALARDPADKNLYRYKVKILIELGRYEEAARTLTRASETGVENAPSYAVQIRAHLDHDEYEKAELYADVAVAFYPNDAGVLRMKGRTSTFLGKYDDALAYYDRALALDADDITAWWWKGYIFLYLGEPEAALECLERVFELYPDLTGIWEPKGTAYFMLDEYAQARAAFEKELALRARDEDILLHLYVVDRADGRSGVERLRPLLQSPKDTWKKDIGRFLAGETSTEDLLTKAGADKSLLCEAHCYIGYKCKFDGDAVAARRHFEEAVATEVRQPLEYILSQHELRRLGVAGE
jgi:tetratricopeptide (TPR) repeat protein